MSSQIKSKYMVSSSETNEGTESYDDFQAIDSSINLEFASVESDGRETYCSDESSAKRPDPLEMYRSLQDDFVMPDHESSGNERFSTPKASVNSRPSGVLRSSIRIYDSSPSGTIEIKREEICYKDDVFDHNVNSLALPMMIGTDAPQSQTTSADEIGRLESVLKRWQANATDDADNDNMASPSMLVTHGDFMRRSPSLRTGESLYPTFTEITFDDALLACLGVSIQPSHYSSSAVLRHTTTSAFACCFSPPANDSRAATDRALVFAIADWKYSETNPIHWQTLASIYSNITGELVTVYRYGSHWEKIGFQGSDPVTDLRSAGYLGLLHLLFLGTQATALAQQCYNLSTQPRGQFPMAITGLNLTRMVMSSIRSGRLKIERNRSNSTAGGHLAASDRFLVASCKLYVALWQHFATIWSTKQCTIENSHEVLQKLEKLMSRQSNQLLKKSSSYLNGSYLLQQRSAMYAPPKPAAEDRYLSPTSFSNTTNLRNSGRAPRDFNNNKAENLAYTDLSVI